MLVLTIIILLAGTTFSVLASSIEPTIGSASNEAQNMTVINNGTDVTSAYHSTKQIDVEANTEGSFYNLTFDIWNTYMYSANVRFVEDSSDYGSIRLILGYGFNHNGVKRQIEVCVRPKLRQAVLFERGWDPNEEKANRSEKAVAVKGGFSELSIGKTFRYTVKYENGKVSFWLDGNRVFDQVMVDLDSITLQPGFYSQNCKGTISGIQIWGDVKAKKLPQFREGQDINHMADVVVSNPLTGNAGKLQNCAVSSSDTNTARMTLYGIQYGDSYCFSTTAHMLDNKNLNGSEEINWEGLIFRVATAKKDNEEYNIELRVRTKQVLVYIVDKDGKETNIDLMKLNTDFGEDYNYLLEYSVDNCFTLYQNGVAILCNYNLATKGYTDIKPNISFGGEVCGFSFQDIKLWGNITIEKAPSFADGVDVNLIPNIAVNDIFRGNMYKLTSCQISNTTKKTGRIDFLGVELKGAYTFWTDATYQDNRNLNPVNSKEYNWEGLIFRVAQGQKDNKVYTIEIRVRKSSVLVYSIAGTEETILFQQKFATAFDDNREYVVEYHENGKLDFWQNGVRVLKQYNLTTGGFSNIEPILGIGGEVCNFSYTNMRLLCKQATMVAGVPKKPQSNGDYADTTYVKSDSVVVFEGGKVRSTTDANSKKAIFEYLPFQKKDTYVYGFNINIHKAEKSWMGPRIIFGTNEQGKELALFLTENSLIVVSGNEEIQKVTFARELYKDYRVDLLIEPKAVSVWIDDILMIEKCKLPKKADATTGIWFEYTVAEMSDIDLYYTDVVEYIKPQVPQIPVLKYIGENQYNAASWMKVYQGKTLLNGYFGNKLSSGDSSKGVTYSFENLPITDNMSYYYSATYLVHESSESWKGPRFIFRYNDSVPMYVAITKNNVLILSGSEQIVAAPYKMEIGKEYSIVMYSTPTTISVWINGTCIFESEDLSAYCTLDKLTAKMGLLFELCKGVVTDLAIYGEQVVFQEDYVDAELYYSKTYGMKDIPQRESGVPNLFENITMTDNSKGSLGAKFDSQERHLVTEFNNGSGQLVFEDASGSSNLNGLKNKSEYVLSFTYQVEDWEAEATGDSGFWFTVNQAIAPWVTKANEINVGMSGNALMIQVSQEGAIIHSQSIPFTRENAHEYDIAIVHGKNWIKYYVDNELKMVATDLPTYNTSFKLQVNNTKSEFRDFELYELEDSGLEVLDIEPVAEKTTAGNTIYEATEYVSLILKRLPILTIALSGTILLGSIIGIVYLIHSGRKQRQEEEE